ncbi:MAG TPA: ABC transporter permease subunit [Terriglobales bacterium]|nr:ABC transporter permease subunit [Terriglobales bacterium]
MNRRITAIATNTFREAVRDRVLYNLIIFALIMIGASLLLGQITIGVQRQLLINLGLTSISVFGVLIAIFIGIGLVSKEIDKRTLYTVLTRPVQRWEFILGKFFGLVLTLIVNAGFMTVGFFIALLYLMRGLQPADAYILVAIYFILLQFMIVTSLALLFSSFSTPIESAVMTFAFFVVGSFSSDLHAFAQASTGLTHYTVTVMSYLVPNFSALNVIASVAQAKPVAAGLVLMNTLYVLGYAGAAVCAASLIFHKRSMK